MRGPGSQAPLRVLWKACHVDWTDGYISGLVVRVFAFVVLVAASWITRCHKNRKIVLARQDE
jgi:hypothetical protein